MVCVYIESLVWHDWPFCLHLQGKINVGRIISVAWSAKLLDKLVHMQLIHALSCLHNAWAICLQTAEVSMQEAKLSLCVQQSAILDGSCQGGLGMES